MTQEATTSPHPAPSTESIRQEVRKVLALAGVQTPRMCDAWLRAHDPRFSRLLARHGLIGLTWPAELGGRGATYVDRLIVTEELLRVGAPVAAHWIADRQIGPAILRYGSQDLQRRLLPRIASGDVTFCLGMSETESGSDLAALRTRAVWDGTHYRITGRKIWTSHAHHATHAYVLARTGGGDVKQEGLTEFVVDLSSPGVEIRPIVDLWGEHHFNEVIFDDVPVPPDHVIGEVGHGWRQVTEQLAFERGGMERVLSTYPLLGALMEHGGTADDGGPAFDVAGLGELVARLHTLRAMALQVAQAMDDGQAPVHQAAMLKYLGTTFEGDVVEYARHAVALPPDPDAGGVQALLATGILASPGFTLRGGTNEILLTIVARQELRSGGGRRRADRDDLRQAVDEALDQRRSGGSAPADTTWDLAVQLGWTGIGVPEVAGGSGGEPADLAVIASAMAYHGRSAPVVEAAVAGRVLASAGRSVDPTRPMTLALASGVRVTRRDGDLVLDGVQSRVPWARSAEVAIVSAEGPDGEVLVELPLGSDGVSVEHGRSLADEPRDTLILRDVRLPSTAVVGDRRDATAARTLWAALHTASMVGAMEAATELARSHVLAREQFGKPLAAFQAVAHTIARMAAQLACAKVALAESLAEVAAGGEGWRTAAARIVASKAATEVCRAAHQVLGAMGITREHALHLATLRLWAWRDEIVSERTLAYRLGQAVLVAGEARTWDWCVHEADGITGSGESPWRN